MSACENGMHQSDMADQYRPSYLSYQADRVSVTTGAASNNAFSLFINLQTIFLINRFKVLSIKCLKIQKAQHGVVKFLVLSDNQSKHEAYHHIKARNLLV